MFWIIKILTLKTDNNDGEDILLHSFYDRDQQANFIAREISKIKAINQLSGLINL